MAWFDWYPGRLEKELDALRDASITFEVDEPARKAGIIRLELKYDYGGDSIPLVALYPEFFPYFPPEVFAPGRILRRHQDPNSRNLCLLGRRSDRWCSDWTLAEILTSSLKIILDYDKTGDEHVIKALEEPQGEPITDYLNAKGLPGSLAIYNSEMEVPDDLQAGWIEARFDSISPPRLLVSGLSNLKKKNIASWDDYSPETSAVRHIAWIRVSKRLSGSLEEIKSLYESPEGAHLRPKGYSASSRHHFALLIQEEVEQFAYQLGWVIFETSKKPGGEIRPIRTYRAGQLDLAARMPTVSLREKSVAVIGIGALGSAVAYELARNGINRIHVIDFDFVEPATVRRWASGRPSFGRPKVLAFADLVTREYPTTRVIPCDMKIGAYRDPPHNDFEKLMTILDDVDVVIDTSIEVGVNGLLSRVCWEMGLHYLLANATPGAWGGRVCQFDKASGHSCWVCYQDDLEQRGAVYQPAFDPAGELQPPGCAARTFTGTSFDLAEISMEAVRVACSLFSGSTYPKADWQIGVCDLRSKAGLRIPPAWRTVEVSRRKGCECKGA